MKDWKNNKNETFEIHEYDVLNDTEYEDSSQLQQILFHIIKNLKVVKDSIRKAEKVHE